MEKQPKVKYKGTFNYYGQVHTLYRYAPSPERAYKLFILELSIKFGVTEWSLRQYFNGTDRYSIESVKGGD